MCVLSPSFAFVQGGGWGVVHWYVIKEVVIGSFAIGNMRCKGGYPRDLPERTIKRNGEAAQVSL